MHAASDCTRWEPTPEFSMYMNSEKFSPFSILFVNRIKVVEKLIKVEGHVFVSAHF